VVLNYAFTDAIVSKDNTIRYGVRLPGVPKHGFGSLTSYEFERGRLAGLGLGAGVYSYTRRLPTLSNATPFLLDGFTRSDLFVSYRWRRWRAQVNMKNVNNVLYYETSSFNIVSQPPRHVVASLNRTY
jgi:iron complex outermembrane recepter protein